jgi:8-oxo-dGTP diphosphatase
VKLQKNPTTMFVVAAALNAADGRIMMHRRPLASQHGGLWEFPGGKIEPGETPQVALARELLEELGIAVAPNHFDFVAEAQGDNPALRIDLFRCNHWTGDPQCLEGGTVAWFEPQALLALAMPPLDMPLAEALIRSI